MHIRPPAMQLRDTDLYEVPPEVVAHARRLGLPAARLNAVETFLAKVCSAAWLLDVPAESGGRVTGARLQWRLQLVHHKQGEAEDGKRDADRVNEIEDYAAFFVLGQAGCPLVGRKAMFFLHLSRHDADARRAKVRIRHRAAAVQGDLARNHEPDQTDQPDAQPAHMAE